jgi:hypothetical protein
MSISSRTCFQYTACVGIVFLLSLIFCSSSLASELRIIDRSGLTRAVREISGPQVVQVEFQNKDNISEVLLTPQDSVADAILGKRGEGALIVFENVSAGIWKVAFSSPKGSSSRIRRVQIGSYQ